MSKETARDFLRQTRVDESLREGFESQKSMEEIVAYAGENGYEFTTDELHESTMEIFEENDIELTEEQLEAAAGGMSVLCIATTWNCGSSAPPADA